MNHVAADIAGTAGDQDCHDFGSRLSVSNNVILNCDENPVGDCICLRIEHFQEKPTLAKAGWKPVFRQRMRQCKSGFYFPLMRNRSSDRPERGASPIAP